MAMLSSYTTLLSPAAGKSSPAAALQQLRRSRQPAAAASVVALRRLATSSKQSRSLAALFICHNDKYGYNDIQPNALVHPCEKNEGDWRLTNEKDQITLKFMVGETSEEKLEVATTKDQVLLVIRYKKEDNVVDNSPASSLDVRLLMPPGYDSNKMQAILWNTGLLEICIPKPTHEPKTIPITPSKKS